MNDAAAPTGKSGSLNRRTFFKSLGTAAAVTTATQIEAVAAELDKINQEKVLGPDPVPITILVNGQSISMKVEPRMTLLEALRQNTPFTGAKEVCDRGTCGACTVLINDQPVYSCMKLAIEAQGQAITTVEGLARDGQLSPVQQAFVDNDALMCGYCTPGFVLSVSALLKRQPQANAEDVRQACAGNLCRCGTYPRIMKAALQAAGVKVSENTTVIHYGDVA